MPRWIARFAAPYFERWDGAGFYQLLDEFKVNPLKKVKHLSTGQKRVGNQELQQREPGLVWLQNAIGHHPIGGPPGRQVGAYDTNHLDQRITVGPHARGVEVAAVPAHERRLVREHVEHIVQKREVAVDVAHCGHALGQEQIPHGHDRLGRKVDDEVGLGVQSWTRDDLEVRTARVQRVGSRQGSPGPTSERLALPGQQGRQPVASNSDFNGHIYQAIIAS